LQGSSFFLLIMEARMKKLKLSLDELAVESFAVDGDRRRPGTVRGNAGAFGDEDHAGPVPGDVAAITGWSWLCGTCKGNTCEASCDGTLTCVNSCGGDKHTLCNNTYCQTKTTTFGEA
jgi:hypothetical protein